MTRTTGQKPLVALIARTSTIALIAMVMPLGIDISGDGDVLLGVPFAHGGTGESGSENGNNGHGNGGE